MVDLFLNRLPNSNTNRPMLVPNAIKLEQKENICESKRKKKKKKINKQVKKNNEWNETSSFLLFFSCLITHYLLFECVAIVYILTLLGMPSFNLRMSQLCNNTIFSFSPNIPF